jgi:hypothetical protein
VVGVVSVIALYPRRKSVWRNTWVLGEGVIIGYLSEELSGISG